jgi:hypothetical protein
MTKLVLGKSRDISFANENVFLVLSYQMKDELANLLVGNYSKLKLKWRIKEYGKQQPTQEKEQQQETKSETEKQQSEQPELPVTFE